MVNDCLVFFSAFFLSKMSTHGLRHSVIIAKEADF